MFNFQEKRVLITGGAGGIGLAAVRQFLDGGARVVLTDHNGEGLDLAATSIDSKQLSVFSADISQESNVKSSVDFAVAQMGGIDIFVVNAGVEGVVQPITTYPTDTFDQVIAVNVKGVWLCLKYGMRQMVKQAIGGSIIVTSSVAGQSGTANMSAYISSKFAVTGLTKVAALEGGPSNIRVNSVHPGPVDNRMMRSLELGFSPDHPEAVKEGFSQQIPLGRYASNEDVAQLICYLASDKASYLSGGEFNVDGGWSASH